MKETRLMHIPFDSFGENGPALHYSHPNAYPPRCFHRFLSRLTGHHRVIAGHHRPLWYLSPDAPAIPGPEALTGWDVVAGDLLRFLDQQKMEGIIGVGHSLGAVATVKAALREPERFRALVLIEPVFLPPEVLAAYRANPHELDERPFVKAALRRRNRWESRQAAYDRFRRKEVFARFSDEALWDYVNAAVHDDPETGEAVLSYPREWEAAFYARPPLDVWEDIPQLAAPTLAVRATESDTLSAEAWALWQTLQPAATFAELDSVGHLLTIEAPEDVAAVVLHWLEDQG